MSTFMKVFNFQCAGVSLAMCRYRFVKSEALVYFSICHETFIIWCPNSILLKLIFFSQSFCHGNSLPQQYLSKSHEKLISGSYSFKDFLLFIYTNVFSSNAHGNPLNRIHIYLWSTQVKLLFESGVLLCIIKQGWSANVLNQQLEVEVWNTYFFFV